MLVTTGWGYLDNSNINEALKHAREGLMSLGDMGQGLLCTKPALEVLRRDESNLSTICPLLRG
ncbi:MAG: hypothetical protein ACLR0U_33940 [Enterocloster clostridioformis]